MHETALKATQDEGRNSIYKGLSIYTMPETTQSLLYELTDLCSEYFTLQ